MATPNMSTITDSLEKSLKNCSLSTHHQHTNGDTTGIPPENLQEADPTVELCSESLPYHWEQCLDLKTGEIYYINWRTGMRTSEDPRINADEYLSSDESDEEEDEDEESSDSSPSSSREQFSVAEGSQGIGETAANSAVLVVAGCKGCFMYYMVPKQNEICPKCSGQLIHFDRSENGSS